MNATDPRIEMLSPAALKPWERNARMHSRKQISEIARSMREVGFTAPIVIDETNRILSGHGRREAARHLGMQRVPCIRLLGLTENQKRAYVLADNKIALNASWDETILAQELELVVLEDPILLEATGFSVAEVDSLVEGVKVTEPSDPADDLLPTLKPRQRRCQIGDLWQLGPHRLFCGNALDRHGMALLMGSEKAQMVFTDPPYNVPIQGHVSGLGKAKHREFAMASGEMTPAAFTQFLRRSFETLVEHSMDGSIHFVCMDWRHLAEMLAASNGIFSEFKNLIVWAKPNGGMGTFYRSRHELIFAFKNGTAPHVNSFELGQHGRYRTTVWEYAGMTSNFAGRSEALELHPTVKPVQMIADAIKDVSERGGLVLDLFAGSGSTLIAAHKAGRRAYVVEIDPVYCDRILSRWETYAHDDAQLVQRTPVDPPTASLGDGRST